MSFRAERLDYEVARIFPSTSNNRLQCPHREVTAETSIRFSRSLACLILWYRPLLVSCVAWRKPRSRSCLDTSSRFRVFRQRGGPKALAVVPRERRRIRDDPRLHRLHHKMDPVLGCRTKVPSVATPQVIPSRLVHPSLGIYEQYAYSAVAVIEGIPKATMGFVARPAADQPPAPGFGAGRLFERLKQRVHALTERCFGRRSVATSFHVDGNAAHGLAPISPIRHRSPNRCSSNHSASFSGSRRRNTVPGPIRSHATMASG